MDRDVAMVIDRIKAAEQWRDDNYREDWQRYYRLYRSKIATPAEGRSNIFVPVTFMQVEVIKARVSESLFATRPYLSVLPRGDEDKSRADKAQMLLDWQMNERMDLERLFNDKVLQSLCCYGTAIVYTGWLLQTRRIRRTALAKMSLTDESGRPLRKKGMLKTRQVQEEQCAVYDDPICQCVDLFDFFVDPNAEDISDARYCGHMEYQTRAQLENMVENGKYRIDFGKLPQLDQMLGGRTVRREENGKGAAEEDFAAEDKNCLFQVHHYWEDDRHMVIINESQCALDEENPFWHGMKPYDKCCYTPLPHEFYGIGVPESLESLQKELNTSRNQRIDYNSMALRRMWKVRKGCGVTPRDLIWRQNGILQVENMDDVQEIQVAGLSGSAFTNEAAIKQDMRDTTGCHDILMGLSQKAETATTTMTKDNNASLRFKNVVGAVVRNLLVPIGKKCLALDQQFLTENRVIRLLNEDGDELLQVNPFELDGEYDLIYVGSAVEPLANKELIKKHTLEAFSIASRHPLYQNDQEALLRLLERVYRTMDMENVKELLPNLDKKQPREQDASGQGGQGVPDQGQALAQAMAALGGKAGAAAGLGQAMAGMAGGQVAAQAGAASMGQGLAAGLGSGTAGGGQSAQAAQLAQAMQAALAGAGSMGQGLAAGLGSGTAGGGQGAQAAQSAQAMQAMPAEKAAAVEALARRLMQGGR